jgi:hypothetical protein
MTTRLFGIDTLLSEFLEVIAASVWWFTAGTDGKASIVTETPDVAAIGACPDDSVAGHPPEIFFHAIGADHEAAGTAPAERLFPAACRAYIHFMTTPFAFGCSGACWFIAHCFSSLTQYRNEKKP